MTRSLALLLAASLAFAACAVKVKAPGVQVHAPPGQVKVKAK